MADAEAQAAAAAAQAKEDAAMMRKAAEDPTEIHVMLDAEFEKKNYLKVHQKLTYVPYYRDPPLRFVPPVATVALVSMSPCPFTVSCLDFLLLFFSLALVLVR